MATCSSPFRAVKEVTNLSEQPMTHFEESQVTYLTSRLRSEAECDSSMFISCNPDPDSFLAEWVDWWLDDDGFPDKEKSGKLRYYVSNEEGLQFADTKEELEENFRECVWILDDKGEEIYVEPLSMTFIGGTIYDNPAMIRANPKYLANLNSLPEVEKARLLHGNWYARPEGATHYKRSWLKSAFKVPSGAVRCRAWDKACTQPNDVNKKPDFTACIGMAKDKNGDFYIYGDLHPENKDQYDKRYKDIYGKFREGAGPRESLILKQAYHDGSDTIIVLAKDPGSGGDTEFKRSSGALISEGFRVKQDPMPSQAGKLTRFLPFSSACEHGLVYIVENTFNKTTLEALHKELESFTGERSTKSRKDDWPDAAASAFNYLCKAAVIPSFTLADFKRNDPFR